MRRALPGSTRTTAMRRARAATLVLTGTVMLAACGGAGAKPSVGDDKPVDRGPVAAASMDALLDRLPSDAIQIDTLDLAALKRKLGVPGDRDPTIDSERPPGQNILSIAAGYVLNGLAGDPNVRLVPIVDLGRVTAAVEVKNFALDSMVLLATPQPRAEIERALATGGFEPVSETRFSIPVADTAPYRTRGRLQHVALGAGFVAAASTPELASAVLATATPAPALAAARRHLDSVRGEQRALAFVAGIDDEDADAECVRLIAGGERFGPARVQDVVLLLSEAPDRRRVSVGDRRLTRDTTIDDYRLRGADVDRRTLRLKVAGAKPDDLVSGVDAVYSASPGWFYRCRGLPLTPETEPRAATAGDRGGNFVEERVRGFITARSSARTRVQVSCPFDHGEPNAKRRCTGTRTEGGQTFHYDIVVTFDAGSLSDVAAVKVTSPDDTSATIMDEG